MGSTLPPGLLNPRLVTAPEPFGYKTAWFAVCSEDINAVASGTGELAIRSAARLRIQRLPNFRHPVGARVGSCVGNASCMGIRRTSIILQAMKTGRDWPVMSATRKLSCNRVREVIEANCRGNWTINAVIGH